MPQRDEFLQPFNACSARSLHESGAMTTIGNVPPVPATALSPLSVVFITINSVLVVFSTLAVILRFLSRRLNVSVGWDDWASLGALVFSYGNFVACVLCATLGRGGFHLMAFNLDQLTYFLKSLFVYEMLWMCSVTLSKLAVLWFYGRIFLTKMFRIQIWFWSAVTVAFWISIIFCLFFQARPFRATFRPWIAHTGLNLKTLYEVFCAVDMAIDIVILCLPQTQLWKLQMSIKKKALLAIVLLLGVLTCITAIFRLIAVIDIYVFDVTYTIAVPGIWTSVEIHLSIICSCAPMFPRLFANWYRSGKTLIASYGSDAKKSNLSASSSGAQTEDSESTMVEIAEPKYAVRVQTDIEIQRIKRSMDGDVAGQDLAKEYRWISG